MECNSLRSVTIPDSVTFIGERAFYYCSSLKSAEIPESAELGDSVFPDSCVVVKRKPANTDADTDVDNAE